MNQTVEEVSAPIEQTRQPRKPAEGGVLGAIRNMGAWTRIAMASLGLLGAAESGCAHAPIVVPTSYAQPERQICVVSKAERGFPETSRPYVISGLRNYLRKRYTNVVTKNLGEPSNYSVYMANTCDDVIHLQFTAERLYLRTKARISNMETERTIEADTDRIDADLFEDVLLKDYHPEQLPPLSLGRIEQILNEEIEQLYAKYEKTQTGWEIYERKKRKLPQSQIEKLKELCSIYLSRFPNGAHIDRVKFIIAAIEEKPLPLAEIVNVERTKVVRELRNEISLGQQAERRGDYREAEKHFSNARQVGYRVVSAYQSARTPIPREVDELGREISRGLRENQERLGIPQVARHLDPDRPGAVFEEGAKLLFESAVASAPVMGEAITNIVVAVEKITANSSGQTSTTASGNGEIQIQTGATGYLSVPCTDTGTAARLSERTTLSCETVGGPECLISNVPPGKYAVSAKRSGGCRVQEKGPVEVLVESGKKVKVDFTSQFAR